MKATSMAVPTQALVHLKKRNGAIFAQLRKHLEANHTGKLDASNRKMLSSALRGLVQSGSVERRGKMYKLRGAIPIAMAAKADQKDAEVPSRKRRKLPTVYGKIHGSRQRARHRQRRQCYRSRSCSHRRRMYHRRRHH